MKSVNKIMIAFTNGVKVQYENCIISEDDKYIFVDESGVWYTHNRKHILYTAVVAK